MPRRQPLHLECLRLVSALYAALGDPARYGERRAECEAWLFRHRERSEPLTAFLRHQLARVAEARLVAREAASGGPSAVVAVDDTGGVMAAGPEAWAVLRSGDPARAPLQLPGSLRTHLTDMASLRGRPPKAFRLHLDDGSGEVAGVLLGVDDMPRHGTLAPARVATLVFWSLSHAAVEPVRMAPRAAQFDARLRPAASDE